MQIEKSFGEICRYCGSNMDVFEPSHFAGTPGTRPTRSAPGPGRIAWPRPPRVMCGAHCQIFTSALVSRGRQP